MEQLALDSYVQQAPARPAAPKRARARKGSLEEQLAAFHAANPHVFDLLRRAAHAALARGDDLRIGKLVEDLRSDPTLRTTGSVFKLDHSLRRPYVELLEQRDPTLAGKFRRRSKRP